MNNENLKVLVTGDGRKSIMKKVVQLTDEQVEQISEKLEESRSEDNRKIENLPSNKDTNERVPEDPNAYESETVTAYVDPMTGEKKPVPTEIEPLTNIDLDTSGFDNLLNMSDDEIRNLEISDEELKESLPVKASKEDFVTFRKVFDRYRKGEDFSVYNALPPSFKRFVDESIASISMESLSKAQIKDVRSVITKSIFDEIIQDTYQNKVYFDLNTSVDNAFKDLSKSITSETNMDVRHKIMQFPKIAEKIKDKNPEKSKALLEFIDSYEEARNYNKLIEAVKTGKLRAKKIELDKFDNRVCIPYEDKYAKSNRIVDSLRKLPFIISRHIGCDAEDSKRIIIAYVKYIAFAKLNIEKLPDYCFMYYFVKNILGMDNYDQSVFEEKSFYTNIEKNLQKLLDAILSIEDNIINKK